MPRNLSHQHAEENRDGLVPLMAALPLLPPASDPAPDGDQEAADRPPKKSESDNERPPHHGPGAARSAYHERESGNDDPKNEQLLAKNLDLFHFSSPFVELAIS